MDEPSLVRVVIRHRAEIAPKAIDVPRGARERGGFPGHREWEVDMPREEADLLVARLNAEPGVHAKILEVPDYSEVSWEDDGRR